MKSLSEYFIISGSNAIGILQYFLFVFAFGVTDQRVYVQRTIASVAYELFVQSIEMLLIVHVHKFL